MEKILGLDLGTNSIGWAIVQRNEDETYELLDKGVNVFQSGVAMGKSGEKPMVEDRTNARALRRTYFRRRLRKIELLKVLVEYKMCPYLSPKDLSDWKHFKKYPMYEDFLEWQKTDDIDGKNPYYDRYVCLTKKLDLAVKVNRYQLGRALYHLAQRRGFLSNRKETTKESDGVVKAGIKSLSEAINEADCKYLGEFFYKLYEKGEKIRGTYTHRTDHYKAEFDAICQKQELTSDLKAKLERAIFYQRPLKSQKGQVGKCTFEKSKPRCPISHPRYEEFRMWSFINNIKVKTWLDEDYRSLSQEEVDQILPLFYRKSKPQFDFEEIAKKIAGKDNYCYKIDKVDKPYRFNFKMYTSVSGCPVTAGLIGVFGEDWLNQICSLYTLGDKKTKEEILNDIWHALFFFDDDIKLQDWATEKLQLSVEDAQTLVKIPIQQGYAALSLNAINKILPYLKQGYRYDEAVMLANLRTVTGLKKNQSLDKKIEDTVILAMRDYPYSPIKKEKSLSEYIEDELLSCHNISKHQSVKLYHPSMIETYQKVKPIDGKYKLASPRTSAVRNPMAMRTLFRLRKLLNELLKDGKIDNETKIRIEFSRGLNDANMRKAIETYQRELEKKRSEYADKIREQMGEDYIPSEDEILKYQLWEEQKHRCPYTGKQIGLSEFIGHSPKYDIEHTIPRSRGGDNSQMNKTLCDSYFNREVKKTQLPYELSNRDAILAMVESFGWQEEIDSLKQQIERTRSFAATKEDKDSKIQRRHYLRMKLNYWEGKLKRFTMTEVPEGFSNRQGVDIGIIGRYARLYLQTVFKNVSTVKGATTAEFRKMWGLQDYYTAKERDSHSHHCVDAITIACIGQKEYDNWAQYIKNEDLYKKGNGFRPQFKKPWPNFTEDVKAVSESILVPHYTPSNLSKHTKKRLRVRGKIQYNKQGETLYMQGDTARASLHKQTFYGAIKKDDEIKYVVRKSLDSLQQSDIDKIVDDVVREKVKNAINAKGFKKAMSETIWMNEDLQIPIKKVRIYVPTIANPILLKEHRDKSIHEHKRFYNVQNDGNYCMAIYEGTNNRGKPIRSFKLINNLEAVNYYNGKTGLGSLVPMSDDNDLPLKCVLKTGTMVLFYEKSPKEFCDCSYEELAKRLYKVTGISTHTVRQGDKEYVYGGLECRHHLEARKATDLKKKNGVWRKNETYRPLIRLYHSQLNAYVEGYDFYITPTGQIIFKHYA